MSGGNSIDRSRVLSAVPLLVRLTESDTRALGQVGQLRRFGAGTTVFSEGDPGDSLVVVIEGEVTVSVLSADGAEVALGKFGPGECFGELALLDGLPRSGTANATRETRALVVMRDDFSGWLDAGPAAGRALLETLSLRLRATSDRISDRQFLSLTQRLIKELLKGYDGSESLDLRCTQAELGTTLGVSRESINKSLRNLNKQGLLKLGRGTVQIADPDRLRRLV